MDVALVLLCLRGLGVPSYMSTRVVRRRECRHSQCPDALGTFPVQRQHRMPTSAPISRREASLDKVMNRDPATRATPIKDRTLRSPKTTASERQSAELVTAVTQAHGLPSRSVHSRNAGPRRTTRHPLITAPGVGLPVLQGSPPRNLHVGAWHLLRLQGCTTCRGRRIATSTGTATVRCTGEIRRCWTAGFLGGGGSLGDLRITLSVGFVCSCAVSCTAIGHLGSTLMHCVGGGVQGMG